MSKANKAQKTLINKTIGCARLVYNLLLSDRMTYYRECYQTSRLYSNVIQLNIFMHKYALQID